MANKIEGYFEIFSGAPGHFSGTVSFWKSGKCYYQDAIVTRRISKARYEHAKELHDKGLNDDGRLTSL